jgi:hypothetical protein
MNTRLLASAILLTAFASPLAHAGDDGLLNEARSVASSLPPKLQATLQAEIGKSGPEGAIAVCQDMAPKIAAEITTESGWKIKRVTLKARNASRAIPDAWEKAALEDFDARAATGEQPAQLEKAEQVANEYRYIKALPVQGLCLSCHGPKDQIGPAVNAALDQHYPNDQATGYALGQIRGGISVRKAIEAN